LASIIGDQRFAEFPAPNTDSSATSFVPSPERDMAHKVEPEM
jgi:hypothetical protein